MASFFEFMKRMVEGRPVFENENSVPKNDQHTQQQTQNPDSPFGAPVLPTNSTPLDGKQSTIVKHKDHTFPVIEVRRVNTHVDSSGEHIEIYCQLHNTWNEEIIIDKFRILNTKLELDYHLPQGDIRDFLVYRGPKLTREDKHAEMDYCTSRDKDYFRAEYVVNYTYSQEHQSYTISDVEIDPPIRDIYE